MKQSDKATLIGLIAIVASLETLLNLEAVDKLDPHKRESPPNRELVAQGVAEGAKIFQAKCNSCHTEPLFTDNSFRNNGLAFNSFLADEGRIRITGQAGDKGKFKVPSLRNVALTPPYMHDGRFATLEQVVRARSVRSNQIERSVLP